MIWPIEWSISAKASPKLPRAVVLRNERPEEIGSNELILDNSASISLKLLKVTGELWMMSLMVSEVQEKRFIAVDVVVFLHIFLRGSFFYDLYGGVRVFLCQSGKVSGLFSNPGTVKQRTTHIRVLTLKR